VPETPGTDDLDRVIQSTAKATANAVYDRLTAELDGDASARYTKDADPVRCLLACYDRTEDVLQVMESRCGASKRRWRRQRPLLQTLRSVQRSLLRLLESHDVRPMETQERVDFRLHEPVHVVHTPRREDEGRIVEVVLRGFVNANGVVRLQQVVVFKFVPRHDQQKEE
jgi:hypothetical protein